MTVFTSSSTVQESSASAFTSRLPGVSQPQGLVFGPVMPIAPLRLVRRCVEFAPKDELGLVPRGTRGIYVLYRRRRVPRGAGNQPNRFDVVYIGLAAGARGGIRSRLASHRRNKGDEWTHFSVYEVWDNVRQDEIAELEGLFRHIYRFDLHANKLNVARSYKKLTMVRRATTREPDWMDGVTFDVQRRQG